MNTAPAPVTQPPTEAEQTRAYLLALRAAKDACPAGAIQHHEMLDACLRDAELVLRRLAP